jgi:general secretion pathway protein J
VRQQSGITLIELLIAMALLAMLGLATAAAINSSLENEQVHKERAHRLEELSYAVGQIRADLEQAVRRKGDAESYPDSLSRMFWGTHGDELGQPRLLMFTRTGHRQVDGIPPTSRLQRVSYRIENDTLLRESSPFPDPVANDWIAQQRLLGQIERVEISYFDGSWTSEWTSEELLELLPQAVRLRIFTRTWGAVELLVMLPGGR